VLSPRALNRTLLHRQHLLERTNMPAPAMVEHLLGLQAQETLPPYLSLWSRIADFDPGTVSRALADRTAVRVLLMRGTIHLVTPRDACFLRPLVQPMLDRVIGGTADGKATARLTPAELDGAVRTALREGALPVKALGERLALTFPGVPGPALAAAARGRVALVQVPPRGQWRRSGGVVYETLETWLGREQDDEPDTTEMVRRYLRAFGPATAADISAWSGLRGMRRVLTSMREELRTYRDAENRELFDLEGLPVVDEATPAPVRLLGRYDNVWLSHDRRDRVTPDAEKRRRWMGVNGGIGCTVFVDGVLEGLWRQTDTGKLDVELFRALSRAERADLDAEAAGVERFLAG
jgi:hypothetical protein